MTDPGRVSTAVAQTILALDLKPEDAGVRRLAEQYAAQIDNDGDLLVKLGPLLLAALAELGASPKARASLHKGGGAPSDVHPSQNELDRVRAQRVRSGRPAG